MTTQKPALNQADLELLTPWFRGIVREEIKSELEPLRQDLDSVKQEVGTIRQDLDSVKQEVKRQGRDLRALKEQVEVQGQDIRKIKTTLVRHTKMHSQHHKDLNTLIADHDPKVMHHERRLKRIEDKMDLPPMPLTFLA